MTSVCRGSGGDDDQTAQVMGGVWKERERKIKEGRERERERERKGGSHVEGGEKELRGEVPYWPRKKKCGKGR